ncbi:MAG TPA: winged helix-turn-helix domain-containing protein, partial [Acidobacteriaceae bacterium]|nr:winged helix-turn-helix domain-containing protein [Acidobacteriaceae bacterium]
MSVLLHLAGHPNRVIPKSEFLQTIWPDTFVSEDALTRCISVLRHLLKDDPHRPRFIKTVAKVGYCLLVETRPLKPPDDATSEAPLQVLPGSEAASAATSIESVASPVPPAGTPRTLQRTSQARIAGVLLTLSFASAVALVTHHRLRNQPAPPPILMFHLTTGAGEESRPALSPNGRVLAFVWAKEDGSHQHIYLKELGSESLARLTAVKGDEYSPAWSPDGRQIAFLNESEDGLALYLAAVQPPGSIRKIYIPGANTRWDQGALAWAPNGKSFVLADHLGAQPSSSLYRISSETLRCYPLTTPPAGWEGDLSPVFSPDGSKIAFVRASESAVMDVYWMPSTGGKPEQVTHDQMKINGLAWSSDNRSVIFSSNRAGEYGLYKVALDGSGLQRMPVGTDDATQPAILLNGRSLVFVQGSAIFGVARLSASRSDASLAKESMLVSSTAQDSAPSV